MQFKDTDHIEQSLKDYNFSEKLDKKIKQLIPDEDPEVYETENKRKRSAEQEIQARNQEKKQVQQKQTKTTSEKQDTHSKKEQQPRQQEEQHEDNSNGNIMERIKIKQQKTLTINKPICTHFPNCKFGSACLNKHPACNYGVRCTRMDCFYEHPPGVKRTQPYNPAMQMYPPFPYKQMMMPVGGPRRKPPSKVKMASGPQKKPSQEITTK
ncbi:hypothetical protein PPERSA_11942 [Pseudocohnilembus persalinus]|uniref:C3H1-type domain-containing protein n=1 Tax=Pseudocohnilembus persalinus TaxID=266149 RepID=A0A0V0QKF6_PSEPJ|nr:hypothetical protein PPERSA_11942 [Pseudocohnilembus persalinus]|eukprot:KRX02602.1 hypothetical protein PPERSA_11942 [Pseudocohnilembus persalinus]